MDVLIAFFAIADMMLLVMLVVVSMARLDRRYSARVRAEHDRKSTIRGHRRNGDKY